MGLLDVLGDIGNAVLPAAGSALGTLIAPGAGTAAGGVIGSALGNLFDNAVGKIDEDKLLDGIEAVGSSVLGGLKKIAKNQDGDSSIEGLISLIGDNPVKVLKNAAGNIITENIDKTIPEISKVLGNSMEELISYFEENFGITKKAAEMILPIISSNIIEYLRKEKNKRGRHGFREYIENGDESAVDNFREFRRRNAHNFEELRKRRRNKQNNNTGNRSKRQ